MLDIPISQKPNCGNNNFEIDKDSYNKTYDVVIDI